MLKLLGTAETNQLIFLYYTILVTTTTMCTSQVILPADVINGSLLHIDCLIMINGGPAEINWELQRSNSSEFVQLDIPSVYFQSVVGKIGGLTISGIRSHHEGLYRCVGMGENNEEIPGSTQFNVTVLGIPWFAVCSDTRECTQPPMNVTRGSSIVINISLVFLAGGFRGINQEIDLVRLRYSKQVIFVCEGDDCRIVNPTYSNRITYTGQRLPWTNITVNISDSRLNDSGLYTVEVETNNPNGNTINTIVSPINITITEVVTPSSTTHISPSAEIIASSSTLQPSVTSITSFITVESGITVSSTVKTHYSLITDVHTLTTAQSSSPDPTDASNQLGPLIASVVLIIVLVPAVLFLGALVVIFYVRHSRETDISASKEKTISMNGSECNPSTSTENGEFCLEQGYNSKEQAV